MMAKDNEEPVFEKGTLFNLEYNLDFAQTVEELEPANDNDDWRQLNFFDHWLPRVHLKMQAKTANDNTPDDE